MSIRLKPAPVDRHDILKLDRTGGHLRPTPSSKGPHRYSAHGFAFEGNIVLSAPIRGQQVYFLCPNLK